MSRRALFASLAVLLFLSLFLVPGTTHGTTASYLLITEVQYDPAGVEPAGEWLEIYNPTGAPVSLAGWKVRDNQSEDVLPEFTLPPGQHVVVAASQAEFLTAFPGFGGNLISLEAAIGGGLANGGDHVFLFDSQGAQVDAMSYGSDASAFSPTCGLVPEGQSLGRWPNDADTDTAGDWAAQLSPNPGGPAVPPATPTPTPSGTNTPTTTLTPANPPSVTPSPTRTPTPTPGTWAKILVTEVEYDSVQEGTDSDFEWLEIFNPTGMAVSLEGWRVADASGSDPLPAYELPSGAYLVVAAKLAGFGTNYPGFGGRLVALDGPIGNGLSNTGDAVKLVAPDGTVVDALSYGSDKSVFDPACPDVAAGQSLARAPGEPDTDSAADWLVQDNPNPGARSVAPTATPTATTTRTATLSPTPGPTSTPTPTTRLSVTPTDTRVNAPSPTPNSAWHTALLITEVLYAPVTEGTESQSEWLEIYNRSDAAVPLDGWRIEDNTASDPVPSYSLPPGAYLVVAASRTGFLAANPGFLGALVAIEGSLGNGLSNTGDRLRLLSPDGFVVDALSYGADASVFDPPVPGVPAGHSIARVPTTRDSDSAEDWVPQGTPNPGGPGSMPTATPTASVTLTPTSSGTPGPTGTPTATATWTTYLPLVVRLNEILPAPSAVDWNGDGTVNSDDEWLELHNRTATPVDLSGWQLDDVAGGGSKPFTLPSGSVLPPNGFIVVFHSQSGVTMNNDGDTIRLLTPQGHEADVFHYASTRPDRSFSRIADDAAAWTGDYAPSPGAANVAPTPTPTPTATATATAIPEGVFLNEVLPEPRSIDWDADGTASWKDEWVELYNSRDESAALGGWRLLDATNAYTIPSGTVLWPHSYLLLFRRQTGLSLSDWRDHVTLLRPDGKAADQFAYESGVGPDRSYCRIPDGTGSWTKDCEVTPGQPNRSIPPPPPGPAISAKAATPAPIPQTIAGARAAKEDSRVVITGTVTVPPGLIARTIYVQDNTGGIKVYLRKGDYPALNVGDQVRVTGWTRDFHGEMEISVPDPGYVSWLAPGQALKPKPITSAGVVEENEGQLVQVVGAVVKYEPRGLVLRDGAGLVRIYFPESLPWRRPYVQIGQVWAAQGVVGQYVGEKASDAGYRIVPRFKSDVVRGPGSLPVTGGCLAP